MNNFQKSLSSNKDCIWEIVKILHPDLSEERKNKIQVYTIYDWVCIKGYGVDLSIQFTCKLSSGPKPLHLFKEELKNNKFRIWRFVGDSKFKLEDDDDYNYLKILYSRLVNDVLSKYNIDKPTAKQMSDYYHSD